jgi:hypothetical protein
MEQGLVDIRMLTRGPNRQYRVKAIVTVDKVRAEKLIAEGHAVAVDQETKGASSGKN